MPSFLKRTLNWLVFLAGMLLGVAALSMLGALEVDGDGFCADWMASGNWRFAITWLSFGIVSIGLSWIALRNRRRAGILFLIAAPVPAFRAYLSEDSSIRSVTLIVFTAFLLMGLFWHRTNRSDWPPLTARLASTRHRVAVRLGALLLLACLVIIGSAAIALVPFQGHGECAGAWPFASPRRPGHTAFVATIPWIPFAIVHEHFWGLPFWSTRFALIARAGIGGKLRGGNTYFIDGHRPTGLVTRFLPMVEIRFCGRSRPVSAAGLDVRILREGRSIKGVRVIGQVLGDYHKPAMGVNVRIIGPMGTITVITDKDGIYDIPDLPAGHYEVRIDRCKPEDRQFNCDVNSTSDFKDGDVFVNEIAIPPD